MKWRRARKKPIVIHFREPLGDVERIHTREGEVSAFKGQDYVIRGVEGEEYPIGREIFAKTYEVLED